MIFLIETNFRVRADRGSIHVVCRVSWFLKYVLPVALGREGERERETEIEIERQTQTQRDGKTDRKRGVRKDTNKSRMTGAVCTTQLKNQDKGSHALPSSTSTYTYVRVAYLVNLLLPWSLQRAYTEGQILMSLPHVSSIDGLCLALDDR